MKLQQRTTDNSNKRILARGCDPVLSSNFARIAPSLTGNAEYVPTTDDDTFIKKLTEEKWSVIYFAPGACRFDVAKQQIPGGISRTAGWSLEQYHDLIYRLQGEQVRIVETPFEEKSIQLLNEALASSADLE